MPPTSSPPPAKPTGRVPIPAKLAWSSGVIAHTFMANILSYLAFPIYNIALGVPAQWLGWAMGLSRLMDSFTDPFMGHISDNTRTRWGRRRPYILLGGLLCALTFALLWVPPVAWFGKVGIFVWFFVVLIFFYLAHTIFVVPWAALGLEMTTDYDERTRLMAWRTFVECVGGLVMGSAWWLAIRFGKWWGGDEVVGVRGVGLLFGLLIAGSAIYSAVVCRERVQAQGQEKLAFVAAVKATFRNPTFLRLGLAMFLIFIGLFTCNVFSTYISLYYIFDGQKEPQAALNLYANGIFQFGGLALTPAVAWIGTRLGKKPTLLAGLCLTMVGYASSWFLYTPAHPYLQLVSFLLMAPGLSCVWVLTSSMLADICDVDELATGLRREGMYGATFSWLIKAGIAGTMVIAGYVLQWSGYNADLVQQPSEVILRMRILYVAVPTVFLLGAIWVMAGYPLTAEKAAEVRRQLDERRKG
jgi:GPH family glycoside/pentoside/hexuronide:cation symporter